MTPKWQEPCLTKLIVPFAVTKYSFEFTLTCFRWLENCAEEGALPHSVNPLRSCSRSAAKFKTENFPSTISSSAVRLTSLTTGSAKSDDKFRQNLNFDLLPKNRSHNFAWPVIFKLILPFIVSTYFLPPINHLAEKTASTSIIEWAGWRWPGCWRSSTRSSPQHFKSRTSLWPMGMRWTNWRYFYFLLSFAH